jgi:RNA polymerase sigma-70 factor (ECF subfamily)
MDTDRDERLILEIYNQYQKIIAVYRNMGMSELDAEEVASEVMVTASLKVDQLRDEKKLVAWLKTIAMNRAVKHFAVAAKTRTHSYHMLGTSDELIRDVAESFIEEERNQYVLSLINALPDTARQIIVLRFWSGYKFSEISEILNMNLNTVKSIYRRSLMVLRDKITIE